MDLEIVPEPTPDEERAIRAALDGGDAPRQHESRWRASTLEDLRGDAPLQDPGREARVVEP